MKQGTIPLGVSSLLPTSYQYGLVLSGDALPDSCLAVLTATPVGLVPDANRALASSELLRR